MIQKVNNHENEMLRSENPVFSGAFTSRNPELSDSGGLLMNVVMVVDDVSVVVYVVWPGSVLVKVSNDTITRVTLVGVGDAVTVTV